MWTVEDTRTHRVIVRTDDFDVASAVADLNGDRTHSGLHYT